MADENQQDPPWGRPIEEDDQATQQSPPDQPEAAEAEQAYHDEPGGAGAPEQMEEPDHGETFVSSEPPPDQGDAPTAEQNAQDASVEGTHVEGEDPYQWHTGRKREHGSTDAVEFIDVVKAFGRNTVLNGLNLGLPEGQISMILGPSGTGKSVCIKHMVGLLYPDEGDVLVHGDSVPNTRDD